MAISIEEVRARLEATSAALSLTLNEVLERYKPNEFMRGELEPYLSKWGNRSLHDFVNEIVATAQDGEPDFWNGDMEPFNILRLLDDLYID